HKLIPSHQTRHDHLQLQERQIPPDTRAGARAERVKAPLYRGLPLRLQEALGAEGLGVRPPGRGVAVDAVRGHGDDRARGEVHAEHGEPAQGDDAREPERRGGVHAQALVDACVEV
ncbi:hypothetical protein C0993_004698, partial [Termitomyces sp. T159_Od127]